jgi:hypothetical protein
MVNFSWLLQQQNTLSSIAESGTAHKVRKGELEAAGLSLANFRENQV